MKDESSDAPSWVPPVGLSLGDLIARVEAAEAASVDLFYAVASALLPDTFPSIIDHDHERVCWRVSVFGKFVGAGAWTDAALALVERLLPRWFVGLQQNRFVGDERRWTAYITLNDDEHEATTYTRGLALLAALLRALQAKASAEGTHDGSSLKSSESLSNDQ